MVRACCCERCNHKKSSHQQQQKCQLHRGGAFESSQCVKICCRQTVNTKNGRGPFHILLSSGTHDGGWHP